MVYQCLTHSFAHSFISVYLMLACYFPTLELLYSCLHMYLQHLVGHHATIVFLNIITFACNFV